MEFNKEEKNMIMTSLSRLRYTEDFKDTRGQYLGADEVAKLKQQILAKLEPDLFG